MYNSQKVYTTFDEDHLSTMRTLPNKIFVLLGVIFFALLPVQAQEEIDKHSETITVETNENESENTEKNQPADSQTKRKVSPVAKSKKKKSWSLAGSCNDCLKVSTGATYLFFSQKPPSNLKDVEIKNFTVPSVLVEGFYRFLPGWRARFEYVSHAPAEIQSDITFLNKSASWSYMGFGADWNAIKPFVFFKHGWIPKIYATYQMHSLPYVKQVGANYTFSSEKVDTLSLGIYVDIGRPKKNWSYFFSQRIQTPVNSGGELKWGSGFGYEGAIGLNQKFANNWSWNIFWGGQYHSYQYADGASSGEYRIGNSMLSVGIGYLK
jgi:hypothetical protein